MRLDIVGLTSVVFILILAGLGGAAVLGLMGADPVIAFGFGFGMIFLAGYLGWKWIR